MMTDCPDHRGPAATDGRHRDVGDQVANSRQGRDQTPYRANVDDTDHGGGDEHHGHTRHKHRHGHHHDHAAGVSEQRIAIAAVLTGAFMVAEMIGGVISGSLALIADAGHMLTDFGALVLAWLAFRLARRPADWQWSYGFDRFSVLAAFGNGLALFAIAGWIVVEAVQRLATPQPVLGGIMLWVAIGGLVVNIIAFLILQDADRDSLNVRAAMLHIAGDLLGSVAAIVAAMVILTTGFTPIDPLLSVLVAVIILYSAWRVVAESGHILLEGTPAGIDTREIASSILTEVPEVIDVYHVHAWSITERRRVITLHARTARTDHPERIVRRIKEHINARYAIAHATVEIEFASRADPLAPRQAEGTDR